MDIENEQAQPSYWNSVLIASLITAIIVVIISLVSGYMTLNSEPSGGMFSPLLFAGALSCLVGSIGGIIVNWHYAKEYGVTYKIGKGALLGLYVAVGATIFSIVFTQLWNLIDPSYTQALMDWNIQNTEAMQMPDEAKEQMIESMGDPNSLKNILYGAIGSLVGLGIVNAISGMIGAKIFASEE
ncbi:DUF4199 family protein [Gracilimonas mengyeensis]|nr:DUF4199 family protein [Gracilimonas mengyeensis]